LQVSGSITDAAAHTVATIPHADRAVYTAKANPVAPLKPVPTTFLDPSSDKGHYTVLFEAGAAPNNGYSAAEFPQGDGYATITVAKTGVVKIVGKLADGSAVSYSNALSSLDEWPLFVQLYGKTGFITGAVKFDPSQPNTDAAGLALKWLKPAGVAGTKLYPTGWSNTITTDLAASKFVPPAADTTPLTIAAAVNATTANIVITATGGGLTADGQNDASLSANGKVTLVGSPVNGLPSLTAALNAKTGLLTGSFKHPVSGKPVTLNGAVYQKTKVASGYFLYTPTASGTVAASGLVSVVRQ
jgi:hypothetical protein